MRSSRFSLRKILNKWLSSETQFEKRHQLRNRVKLAVEAMEDRVVPATFAQFIDPNPSASNGFGSQVVPLSTGNVVITAPFDDAGGTDAGAVYLFNGSTGALISTLTGTSAGDNAGVQSISVLNNGNFLVRSPSWDNVGATNAGAVTWGSGTAGVSGPISASNSLVGTTAGDNVGGSGVTLLSNGNYFIRSTTWDNGPLQDAGAVTWGSGTSGISGVISSANSLVGSTSGDGVGSGVTVLNNGNYVVRSTGWDNGASVNAGAVTWGSGTSGISGVVSVSNSLVGTAANDAVGSGLVALNSGNYVVISSGWDNGALADVGAVTWGSGTSGISGLISDANSLIGNTSGDAVGNLGVVPLSNGNYVVRSTNWDNGASANAGAVTWASGTFGITGTVNAANSLVGTTSDDSIGSSGVISLNNGNYVVVSPGWDNGLAFNAGAVTWGNGASGVVGAVNASNSLVGDSTWDEVGDRGVFVLGNGNYIVRSEDWHNDLVSGAGAVTWGSGTSGITGVVSASNSLVGGSENDQVGVTAVIELTNGNYVILSRNWHGAFGAAAGAVTWGDGNSGVTGVVSASNSLVGKVENDGVGGGGVGVVTLNNGNYVVISPSWDDGSSVDVGAVTWGSGVSGVAGNVSPSNSLVGSTANDAIGNFGVLALSNGNYVVGSPDWSNGAAAKAGAATWGSGISGIVGAVSPSNSLVGTSANDFVGDTVIALGNGNYVVPSVRWDNGGAVDVGAVTWGSGASGVVGVVSSGNSLVGTMSFENVGIDGIVVLNNSNYLVRSASWDNGGLTNAGAVTWGSGSSGVAGVISPANSLVGTTAGDSVGGISGAVVALSNGNYVVRSTFWDSGTVQDVGAVTWGSGTSGVSGSISSGNSLIGTTAGDNVGNGGVTALSNGSYLVRSTVWDNGALVNAGAFTWGSGTSGVTGTVSADNSLVGTSANTNLIGPFLDSYNDAFYARFSVEGRVRAGSQSFGIAAPTNTVTVNSGNLTIAENGLTRDLAVTLRIVGSNLEIHDPGALFSTNAGTGSGSDTISIPLSTLTGQLVIQGGDGADTLTLDFANGNPIPVGGLSFVGGDGFDTLEVLNAPTGNAVLKYTNAYDGSITLPGGSVIEYTGLDPITYTTSGGTLEFDLTNAVADDVTATLDVNGDLVITGGIETTTIPAATLAGITSIKFTGEANDKVTIESAISKPIVFNVGIVSLKAPIGAASSGTATSIQVSATGRIQDAVHIASAITAATVDVAAGVYQELVAVNKAITLHGANVGNSANGATNRAARVAETILSIPMNNVNSTPGGMHITANNVTIDGFSFEGVGSVGGETAAQMVIAGKNVQIKNTIFNGKLNGPSYGTPWNAGLFGKNIVLGVNSDFSGLSVTDSFFARTRTGVFANPSSIILTGITFARDEFVTRTGVNQDFGPSAGITVQDSVFGAAIVDGQNYQSVTGLNVAQVESGDVIVVSGTVFDTTFQGIRLGDDTSLPSVPTPIASGADITITDNVFTPTMPIALNIGASDASIDAGSNYFGPNGVNGHIVGNGAHDADVSPVLTSSTDADPGTPGFQSTTDYLIVDPNNTTSVNQIQEAIDSLPAAGGTIRILSGTYTGNITTGAKAVKFLIGSSPGITTLTGNLILTALDEIVFDIDGAAAGTGFDQWQVNGNIDLGGAKATILFGSTLTPAKGSFALMTATGTISNAFGTIDQTPATIPASIGYSSQQVTYSITAPSAVTVRTTWANPVFGEDADDAGSLTLIFGYDAFLSVQNAVTAVAPGGTVTIGAGTYTELVTVDHNVNFVGSGVGATSITGTPPMTITGAATAVSFSDLQLAGALIAVSNPANAVVAYSSVISRTSVGTVAYGTIGSDTLGLRHVSFNNTRQLQLGGSWINIPALGSVTIYAQAGADDLSVDFGDGAPIDLGGVYFDGGADGDSLSVVNVSNANTVFKYTNQTDGSIQISGAGTISYANLEPIAYTATGGSLEFDFTNANTDDVTATVNVSGDLVISGTTFETTTIPAATLSTMTSITFSGQAADKVTIASNLSQPVTFTGIGTVTLQGDVGAGSTGDAATVNVQTGGSVADGVAIVGVSGIVNVAAGTFVDDVDITKDGVKLLGAGPGVTVLSGAIGGSLSSTVKISASNVEVAGFTITRQGNNTTDWYLALNTAGMAIQGQAVTNALIHDNLITGNRTGIDVNDTSGHTIRNNVIDNNRTGVFFRNVTDFILVTENVITNNWTLGVLFGDAGTATQSAHGTAITNNNISGNWYGQIVDRQSSGLLPAPGTTNLKNVSGNWFGTMTPVIAVANSVEPGYGISGNANIPVAFGGTAAAPGGQPDILGLAVENFDISPLLQVGTDTDMGTYGFQGDFTTVKLRTDLAQTGAASRLQEAAAAVTLGGTVVLPAGDVAGDATIAQNVYISGPGYGATQIVGNVTLLATAADVTFENLSIVGAPPLAFTLSTNVTLTNVFLFGVGTTDVYGTTGDDQFELKNNSGTIQLRINGGAWKDIPAGSLDVHGLAGNDTLAVDLSGGNALPGNVTFDGGAGVSDTLLIAGGIQGTATYNLTGPDAGSVALSAFSAGTIAFNTIESVANSGTAADVQVNLPTSGNVQAVLEDDGVSANGMSGVSSPFAEFVPVTFVNPTASLTLNRGSATDDVTIESPADFTASLNLGSNASRFDAITFNGAVTLATGNSLTAYATGSIALPNAASDIAVSGVGTVSLTTTGNISLSSGSSIAVVDGALTLSANQQVVATTGNFVGIDVNGGSISSSGLGVVTVKGRGGDDNSTPQFGIQVRGGGSIVGGTAGTSLVEGVSGASSAIGSHGAFVTGSSSKISSSGGDIKVVGTAGGTGIGSFGVVLADNAAFTTVLGGGNIEVVADSIDIDATGAIAAGSGDTLLIRPQSSGIDLHLRDADGVGTLGLSAQEVTRLFASSLTIGDGTVDEFAVLADVVFSAASNVRFSTGGNMSIAGTVDIDGGNLQLEAGGTITPNKAGLEADLGGATTSVLSFAAGSEYPVAVNGPVADVGYVQWNVAGKVDLTNVTLNLTGSYMFVPGDVVTLVSATAVAGEFVSYPDNTLIPNFNGRDIRIHYTSTSVYLQLADIIPPSVTGIVRLSATPSNNSQVAFLVTFNETVTGVDATDFVLSGTGIAGATIQGVTPLFPGIYRVDVATGADGTLRVDVKDNGSIKDSVDNLLYGPGIQPNFVGGETFVVDRTAPTVTSIVRTGGSSTNAASVTFTVTFNEAVNGVSSSNFTPTTTGAIVGSVSVSQVNGSGAVYTVTVSTGTSGNGTIGLDYTPAGVVDLAGNVAVAGFTASELYTIDRVLPSAPLVGLLNDTNVNGDKITSVGELSVTGAEAGAAVQYSTDGGSNWVSTFAAHEGANAVKVRQIDTAGNVSAVTDYSFTLDTLVAAPGVALTADTGVNGTDKITWNGALTLTDVETGALVQYSTDNGANWTAGFTLIQGSNTVLVRQKDLAGNQSGATSFTFTYDSLVVDPTVALVADTGIADTITSNGGLSITDVEANALIEYSVNNGPWNPTFAPVQGLNLLRVRQTDLAGNTSPGVEFDFTLDSIAPALPNIGLVSDTGSSPVDRITRNASLVDANGELNALVEYSIDNGTWGSYVVPTADGTYTVRVRQTDVAGNVSEINTLTFQLDATVTSPGVSLTTDTADPGDQITSVGALTLTLVEPNALVQFSVDNGTSWSTGFTPTQGSNTVLVRQTDVAGNESTPPTSFTFVFDTIVLAPVVALTEDTGSSSSDKITSNGLVTVTATEASATIQYSINGGASWTGSFMAVEGVNSVLVRQTDEAGNVSPSASLSFTLDTIIDTPTVVLAHDTGISGSDKLTSDGSLSVGNIESGALVEYSTTEGATWNTSFTPVQGSNKVRVRQTDAAGNTASSVDYTFDLDSSAPLLQGLSDIVPNVRSTSVTQIDVRFSDLIDAASFTSADLSMTRDGLPVTLTGAVVAVDGSDATLYHITLPSNLTAANGVYAFKVDGSGITDDAANAVGGSLTSSWSMNVNAAPAVPAILGPFGPITDVTPTIAWTASSFAARYDLAVYNLTTRSWAFIKTGLTTTQFTPTTDLTFGSYRILVRSYNGQNVVSAWCKYADFTIAAPKVSAPTGTVGSTPALTWSTVNGAAKYQYLVIAGGRTVVNKMVDAPTTSTMPPAPLPVGNYRIIVRAIDAKGFGTAWSTSVNFSVGVPTVVGPVGTASSSMPMFEWTSIAGADHYDVRVLSASGAGVLTNMSVSGTTFTAPKSLATGTYNVYVRAIFVDGKATPFSLPGTFRVGIPTITSLAMGAVTNTTPVIDWMAVVPAPARYELLVVDLSAGNRPVIHDANIAATASPSYQSPPLTLGHAYRVLVRAIDASGKISPWSTYVDFFVGNQL